MREQSIGAGQWINMLADDIAARDIDSVFMFSHVEYDRALFNRNQDKVRLERIEIMSNNRLRVIHRYVNPKMMMLVYVNEQVLTILRKKEK